jgi:hypothetical protein
MESALKGEQMKSYRKAIVAAVGAIVAIAAVFGVIVPASASEAIVTLAVVLTAIAVERTPNA